VDEERFFHVLCTRVLQLVNGFRKKINRGFASGKELRFRENNSRKANRGDDLSSGSHRRHQFLKLFIVPQKFRNGRTAAKHHSGVIISLGVGNRDICLGRATFNPAAHARCGRSDNDFSAFILEDLFGFEKFLLSELSVRNHHENFFSIQLHARHYSVHLLEYLLMIHLKSPREIETMKGASKIVGEILLELRENLREGATTADIDKIAEDLTLKKKAKPAFKGYRGFPASLCISVNDQVVHGIPSPKRLLKNGDIVGLDFGVIYDGYYGDSAMTVAIGQIPSEVAQLVKITEQCLYRAIEQAVPGNFISDISAAVQRLAEANNYGIVREFCGHGIGRSLHEDPPVLNYVQNGKGPKIKPGFVIAIEPMINLGTDKVRVLDDGWTVVTADGKPSAHFEHTIAVTANGPEILTKV